MLTKDLSGTFSISSKATSQGAPAVAGIGTQFLVVWQSGTATNHDIKGTWVKVN